jgi:hypothetical protein
MSFTSSSEISKTFRQLEKQPILVIGGSDGSGTRAVVDTIRELGGIIVADDTETFDVHASELWYHQGWPGLVKQVLNITHSANYEYEQFIQQYNERQQQSQQQQQQQHKLPSIDKELMNLQRTIQAKFDVVKRYHRRQYQLRIAEEEEDEASEGGGNRHLKIQDEPQGLYHQRHGPQKIRHPKFPGHDRHNHVAQNRHPLPVSNPLSQRENPTMYAALTTKISYVIKAPVSMLLLPLLTKYLRKYGQPMKFLHVIRE